MRMRRIAKGILTFIPCVRRLLPRGSTGGTNSAAYCYEVWMKHLTMLWEHGMHSLPASLAELGPGDSLGIGLAAMLSGVDRYYALDVVRFSDTDSNLAVFEELVSLFKARAPGSNKGWPEYDAYLDENLFPSHILTNDVLDASLSVERIGLIRNALLDPGSENNGIGIKYMVPWSDEDVIEEETVDLILSHAVLEHVVDLEATYSALHRWLRPGGMMSHQIGFTSHGITEKWNGYWAISERMWRIILGKRPYLINRQPCSVHMDLMRRNAFKIICLMKKYRADGIQRSELSPYWKDISDDDLTCSDIYVQAQRSRGNELRDGPVRRDTREDM
jgi:SAM-dependent methyltransferase